MEVRTPLVLISGSLGSGKTTLLRHILASLKRKIAILMNEFGEIAIDSRIVEGRNIRITELDGGCVCCSLLGEFEAAVEEVIDTVDPEMILVETTGVAEPEAIVFDIQESLSRVRLDRVVTLVDAEGLVQYPQLGRTTRLQIEEADIMVLNKMDLVSQEQLIEGEETLRRLNELASIVRSERCRVDPELLFGVGREREVRPPSHTHQPEYESFSYVSDALFDRDCFERMVNHLDQSVYRAKGFVRFPEEACLFNYVAGRWELESFEADENVLVFIGKGVGLQEKAIVSELKKCERSELD